MVYYGSIGRTSFEVGFPLRCFQRLSLPYLVPGTAGRAQPVHQWYVHPGPLVLGTNPLNSSTPMADRDRTVSRRSEPRLTYHFNWRTAKPGPTPAPGCDEPTSRCHTLVDRDSWRVSTCCSSVPLSVERWPFHSEPPDHYDPSFDSARLVSLAVRQAYAIALYERFLTVLSLPSHASVTFWEATAPVKLPTIQCLAAGLRQAVRCQE